MPSQVDIEHSLLSPTTPVATRMRAIFGLKALKTPSSIKALETSLHTDSSALVRHEVAYVLGQMQAKEAIPSLIKSLRNADEDVMVRHEAAEALGAIGDESAADVLREHSGENVAREISETCQMALERIKCDYGGDAVYNTVDPAPAEDSVQDVKKLEAILCNDQLEMYKRYKAMFALRNMGGADAVAALCRGFEYEKGSALFRHEVAYVLGQMRDERAIPTLTKFLKDEKEHEMVRHEAAEALGSIGTQEAERILEDFRNDDRRVVRESVEVALDISDYMGGEDLQYAQVMDKQ